MCHWLDYMVAGQASKASDAMQLQTELSNT